MNLIVLLVSLVCVYGNILTFSREEDVKGRISMPFSQRCHKSFDYEVTPTLKFKMCTAQNLQEERNSRSIVGILSKKHYLPTCRIMHLLLWMRAEVHHGKVDLDEIFADIGMNIGSCTAHMAALGYKSVSIDPVDWHVKLMSTTTVEANRKWFGETDVLWAGISSYTHNRTVRLVHGAQNFGSTAMDFLAPGEERGTDTLFKTFRDLRLFAFDDLVEDNNIALVKIDCEGCEWEALAGANKALERIPLMKIEFELQLKAHTWRNGTGTHATHEDLLDRLAAFDFRVICEPDKYSDVPYYFGRNSATASEIDSIFGSNVYNLPFNSSVMSDAARSILTSVQLTSKNIYEVRASGVRCTDIIAIKNPLLVEMQQHFLR